MNRSFMYVLFIVIPLFAIQNPYEKIKHLTAEEKIVILTNHFFKQYNTIKKNLELKKPYKPILPIPLTITKNEFETTDEFNARVKQAKVERLKKINDIYNSYQKKIDKYNQKISIINKKYNERLKNLEKNKDKNLKKAIEKAISIVYGKPKLVNLFYNADEGKFYGEITSTKNNFNQKISIQIPKQIARVFKNNVKSIVPNMVFEYKKNKLLLKEISIPFQDKKYLATTTDKIYTPSVFKVEIDTKEQKFQKPKYITNDLTKDIQILINQFDYSIKTNDDIPILLSKIKASNVDSKNWLFVIGIERYDDIDNVIFSTNSAKRFKEVAKKTLGIKEQHCKLLIHNKTTSANIKYGLKQFLRNINDGDTIYFYYSGHGIPIAQEQNTPYILPSDLPIGFIQDNKFFKLKNIYALLSKSKASKVIIFIDTCFSGATDGKSILEGVAAPTLQPREVEFDKNKIAIITAGKNREYSNMFKIKGHRLFSYFLMRSLINGKKDIKSLYKDLFLNVKNESYKLGDLFIQHPVLYGNKNIKFGN